MVEPLTVCFVIVASSAAIGAGIAIKNEIVEVVDDRFNKFGFKTRIYKSNSEQYRVLFWQLYEHRHDKSVDNVMRMTDPNGEESRVITDEVVFANARETPEQFTTMPFIWVQLIQINDQPAIRVRCWNKEKLQYYNKLIRETTVKFEVKWCNDAHYEN